MLYSREIVHYPKSNSESLFITERMLQSKTFQEAGVLQGGYGLFPDDFYVQRTARRGYHVFVFTLSGKGQYILEDGTEFFVHPGQCFVTWSKGQGHMERTAPGEMWEIMWFTMEENKARFYPSTDDYDIIETKGAGELKSILNLLKNEELVDDKITPQKIELLEELFLLTAKRSLGWGDRGPVSRNREILTALWTTVSENPGRPWTVEELSKEAGISRTHLNRLCLQLYQTSPGNRVRDMKLSQAKVFLKNSGMTIGEISDHLGFSSISIFSHAFKEYYGITPREFRKKDVPSWRDAPDVEVE